MKKNLKKLKHCSFYNYACTGFLRANDDGSYSRAKYVLNVGTASARLTTKELRVFTKWAVRQLREDSE